MESRRAGFALAVGRSFRMGQDKALLPWKGSTRIESVAREVFAAAGSVTLIGSPERYGNFGFPIISDRIAGCGPLCAVYNARLLSAVESAIHSKLLKMHNFVSRIQARTWPAPDPSIFRNLNTPEQLLGAR